MTTLREAVAQALDALTKIHPGNMSWETGDAWMNAVQILREALAQPDPNPFGYFQYSMQLDAWVQNKNESKGVAFYTQPPQREWVGLTDAELEEFSNMQLGSYDLCDAVEERLEEKNRG